MTEIPHPSLVVLVGPAGSGKSTWAMQQFRQNEIVSLSQLRALVGTGEDDLRATPVAYEILERVVDVRLARGLTVVIDTPGLDDRRRARWRRAAEAHSVPALAVFFRTDVGTCLARNADRSAPLATTVIERQAARCRELFPTIESEGFEVLDAVPGRHGAPGR